MKTRRIVCYAVNGAGLGHVSRLIAVGRWLRRYVTMLDGRAPEIVFLTSSEATELLDRAGFLAFKLPSKTVARRAGTDIPSYKRLARHFVWHTLGVFAPDLLVVDTFPSGSFDELFQVLDGPMTTGLIHREVKPEYAARPTFRAALDLYDTVVVPHKTGCGEVLGIDREELPSRAEIRADLGLSDDMRLVYVSAGGGGDPHAEQWLTGMITTLLGDGPHMGPDSREAAPLARSGGPLHPLVAAGPLHLLVGAGPLYRGRRIHHPGLTWIDGPGVVRYFPGCDAALSAAGYNTFHELLYLRVPTAFFAQPKVADDQAARIAAAEALGACVSFGTPDEAPTALATVLDRAWSLREACPKVIADNGAARCARALLAPRYPEERLAWAEAVLDAELAARIDTHPSAADLLGRVLPRLLPPGSVDGLAGRSSMTALLSELSEDAAREVRAALNITPEAKNIDQVKQALSPLLLAAGDGFDPLTLLEAAVKKYPFAQQAPGAGGRVRWVVQLLETLGRLAGADEDTRQVWRVFPRLVDNDLERAAACFWAWRARQSRPAAEQVTALQALKLANRRVTRELVD